MVGDDLSKGLPNCQVVAGVSADTQTGDDFFSFEHLGTWKNVN